MAQEVLPHLFTLPGAEVEVSLELHVRVLGGVSDDVVQIVNENAQTLKFTSAGFEQDRGGPGATSPPGRDLATRAMAC